MRSQAIHIILAAILALFPLGGIAQQQDIVSAVLAANRAMEDAFNTKEYAAVAAFYTDDAVLITDANEVSGREAIDAYWSGMESLGISWELENTEIIPDRTSAVQRGISHLTYRNKEGREVVSRVKFTLLWVERNGEWKIRIDHYSRL
ncbi:YybH family protein [Robertkochia flava]|uniref:YybH family protein n=1 Tax=Robertkochia flava TaxID=3447986 RepID=UPI001CCB2C2B|nr:nuclear transport factor 2 family protein [Robertkochia marina]